MIKPENRLTRSEFQSSDNLMAQLDEVLKFPVVEIALDIVRREITSGGLPVPIPGVPYADQVAAEGAKALGGSEAIDRIYSLTRKPKAKQRENTNQQDLYVSDAVKRVASSKQYTSQELRDALDQGINKQ